MKYSVLLTGGAKRDLTDLATYIAEHDSLAKADLLLDGIVDIIGALETMPERGRHPPELLDLGFRDIRERFFKPYRILYRIDGHHVSILLIADGRRDMKALLMQRLLD
jgi:toxin ParE1/3/4